MNKTLSLPTLLPTLIFLSLLIASRALPAQPVDPWGVFSIQSLFTVLFALGLIQNLGTLLIQKLGTHNGSLIHGFFAGIISSTAFTVSLARESRNMSDTEASIKSVALLSATLAMLLQGSFIVFMTAGLSEPRAYIPFVGPTLITLVLMRIRREKTRHREIKKDSEEKFRWLTLLKLAIFIVLILSGSKVLQKMYGTEGLSLLTFLVSLFEIHGSLIANGELFHSSSITLKEYTLLISLSLGASYFSKIFLILIAGSNYLKIRAVFWFTWILLSIAMSELVFLLKFTHTIF